MGDLRHPKFLLSLGYTFVGIGVLLAISDAISNIKTSYPLNAGVLASGVAIAGVGVIAISAAKNFQRLEARINETRDD